MEFQMATEQPRATGLKTPVSSSDHVIGPEAAPVVIVEYGDFECPNCKQAAPALKQLLVRHARQVQLVYRHLPLEAGHPQALQAAEAAECAAAQGKFWAMHDLLFENQPRLRPDDLRSYAVQLGLDMRRYDDETLSKLWLAKIRAQLADGEQSGVRSTPGIFLNGRIQDVSFGFKSLFDAIDAILQRR
jgi:protein-disulfide isomerase